MPDVISTSRFKQGSGRLCLDFVRTLRHRGTAEVTEDLEGPAALSAWVGRFGPSGTLPLDLPSGAETAEARSLREAIHELLAAARGPMGAAGCRAEARQRINRAAALPVPAPVLDASGRLHWLAQSPVSATLALVARDALDLATSKAVLRVRECAAPTCSALFYDGSRPGTRRWCSMDLCGNVAKKETLRLKAAQQARGGG